MRESPIGSLLGAGLLLASVVLPSFLFQSCADGIQREQVIWHPITDSLSIDPADAIQIQKTAVAEAVPNLAETARRIRARSVSTRIGVLDGPSEYTFGELVDGEILPSGRIALLDGQALLLRIYDSLGNYLYSLGGAGEGPGEFGFPVEAMLAQSGDLLVVEGARGIQRFQPADGQFVFRERIQIPSFQVRDACVSGENAIIHVPSHVVEPDQTESAFAEVLFRYGPEGGDRFGFSVPYRYAPRLAAERLKRGRIACGKDGRVYLAFESQNRLDAYSAQDGRLLWHATFNGINIPPVRERIRPDGRIGVGIDVRGGEPIVHFLLGLTGGHGNPLIVQFGRRTQAQILGNEDGFVVESFLVDPEVGEGFFLGEDLPQVLLFEGDEFVTVKTDPFPQVEVSQLPPRLGGLPSGDRYD